MEQENEGGWDESGKRKRERGRKDKRNEVAMALPR